MKHAPSLANFTRLAYVCWLAPLFTLLGCGGLGEAALGLGGSTVLAAFLLLAVWAVVWLRLATMGGKSPEWATLAVVPHAAYYALRFAKDRSPDSVEVFSSPFWQNVYFLFWMAALILILATLRPGRCDAPKSISRDPFFLFMAILATVYALAGWSSCTASLFPFLIL